MKAAAHLMEARKQKERKKKAELYNSFGEYPSRLIPFHLLPLLKSGATNGTLMRTNPNHSKWYENMLLYSSHMGL